MKGVFIMKKALKLTALCLVLVMALAVLASCGGPSGKYTRKDTVGILEVESYYEFDGDKVSFSVGTLKITDATYEINDGKIKITYTTGGVSLSPEYTYELDGDTLKIDGIAYTKE